MIFVHHIKTPANTPSSAPIVTDIPIVLGVITLVSVQFPPGCNALAHLHLDYGLNQLFPSNQDGDFATGGETISWVEAISIPTSPAKLIAYSWNEDTLYDHTITVRIVMEPAAGVPAAQDVITQVFQQQAGSQQ